MTLPSELVPRKHAFVPDRSNKGDTCEVCGEVDAFGALHVPAPVEVEEDSAPRLCSCGHFEHRGVCWGAIPAFPEPKRCPCESAA